MEQTVPVYWCILEWLGGGRSIFSLCVARDWSELELYVLPYPL